MPAVGRMPFPKLALPFGVSKETKMGKAILTFITVLVLSAGALPSSQQEDKQIAKLRRIGQEFLDKVNIAIKRETEEIEKYKKDPTNRDRLVKVRDLIVEKGLLEKIDKFKAFLEDLQKGPAFDEKKTLLSLMEEVISILDDVKTTGLGGLDIDYLIKKADEIRTEEGKILKDIEAMLKNAAEFEKWADLLNDLARRQGELANKTDVENKTALLKEIDSQIAAVKGLIGRQEQHGKETRAVQSDHFKKLVDFSVELAKLIREQEEIKRVTKTNTERLVGLEDIIGKMSQLVKDQEKIISEISMESSKKDPDYAKMIKSLNSLAETLWEIGNKFYNLAGFDHGQKEEARIAMEKAFTKIKASALQLDFNNPSISADCLKESSGFLQKSGEAFKKLLDGSKKNSAVEFEALVKSQKGLESRASDLSTKMSDAANQSSAVTKKVLETASKFTKLASGNMNSAAENVSKILGRAAERDQDQAIQNLTKAKEVLDEHAKVESTGKKNDFNKLADVQGEIGKNAHKLAAQIGDLADKLGKVGPNNQAKNAQNSMKNASNSMNQSQDALQTPDLPRAENNQNDATKHLKDTLQALENAKNDMASGLDPKKLEIDQEKLREDLAKAIKWAEAKGKELESSGKSGLAKDLKDALAKLSNPSGSGNSKGANEDMKEASGKLAGNHVIEANKNQRSAEEKIKDAANIFKSTAKKAEDEANDDREKLQIVIEKQKEAKQMTEEFLKQLEKLNQQIPGTTEGAKNALQSMGGASDSAQEGRPKKVKNHILNAIKDLDEIIRILIIERDKMCIETERELIRYIETRLKEILEKQVNINKKTQEMDSGIKKLEGKITQQHNAEANDISRVQHILSSEMSHLKDKLATENVKIFIFAFEQIIDEMDLVAGLLEKVKVDRATQEVEADIVAQLKQLVDTFDLLYENFITQIPPSKEPPRDPGERNPPRPIKKPLVPDEVQLNLFKKMQESILARTQTLEKKLERPEQVTELEKTMLSMLRGLQGRLAGILDEFIKELKEREKEDRVPDDFRKE